MRRLLAAVVIAATVLVGGSAALADDGQPVPVDWCADGTSVECLGPVAPPSVNFGPDRAWPVYVPHGLSPFDPLLVEETGLPDPWLVAYLFNRGVLCVPPLAVTPEHVVGCPTE